MLHHLKRTLGFGTVFAVLAADIGLYCFTDPAKVSSAVLGIAVLLLTTNVYLLLRGVLAFCRLLGVPFPQSAKMQRYVMALVLVIVALGSTGELSVRDVAVLVPLGALAYLYTSYVKKGHITA